jgi:hypothetical protein
MKNIKFAFGIIILCLFSLNLSAQPGITTDRDVTFLHGLGESGEDWQPFVDFFNTNEPRRLSPSNPTFTSSGGLNNITSSANIRTSFDANSLAICHSLGGVVARRLDRTTTIGGIVTIGSPLDGAPSANSSLNGNVANAIGDAAYAIGRGPLASFGFGNFGVQIFGNFFGSSVLPGLLEGIISPSNFGDVATMSDVQVGGSGIEADKNAPPTNTPKISIWGNEESPIHWNIIKTSANIPMPTIADVLGYAYLATSIVYGTIAAINWYNPYGWYCAYTAYQWFAGYDWIINDSERIYNNLIGSDMVVQQCVNLTYTYCTFPDSRCAYTPQSWQYCMTRCTDYTNNVCFNVHNNGISDAFIPAVSQRGDGSPSWRTGAQMVIQREALGVNHLEELDANNQEMQARFNEIFNASNGIPQVFRIDRR